MARVTPSVRRQPFFLRPLLPTRLACALRGRCSEFLKSLPTWRTKRHPTHTQRPAIPEIVRVSSVVECSPALFSFFAHITPRHLTTASTRTLASLAPVKMNRILCNIELELTMFKIGRAHV